METQPNQKKFELEERVFRFAESVRALLKELPHNSALPEDRSQLTRSSGSVAANYIEANESLSTKDFVMRIKIARKEAKESYLWLRLIKGQVEPIFQRRVDSQMDEASQLVKILNAIAYKFREASDVNR